MTPNHCERAGLRRQDLGSNADGLGSAVRNLARTRREARIHAQLRCNAREQGQRQHGWAVEVLQFK